MAIDPPTIIPRSEHVISRANISEPALNVLYRLKKAGFSAYLVGGCVRDLLLGREPKDFDVTTDARPEQIRDLFRSCRLVGRRFRLAHLRFGREIIETATFRGPPEEGLSENGRIVSDNVYGTLEQDAWRRDFSVNALYYNIRDFSVVDYTRGMEDLEAGRLRLIGDPVTRYREDPVRMLRAVRFAAKLGFTLHPDSETPIWELAPSLQEIPSARLFEEILKLFLGGCAVQTFELLRRFNLFRWLFPQTEACLGEEEQGFPRIFLAQALNNTDARIAAGKPVTPAFLFAALLWEPVRKLTERYQQEGVPEFQAMREAAEAVLANQTNHVALPRRFSLPMREIWYLQPRFAYRRGKRPLRLLQHPRFRAAYDFLLLRAQSGEDQEELCQWWTEFQEMGEKERLRLVRVSTKSRRRKPRKRVDKPVASTEV
ncbi:polynucleotide adenylyltransferase PcnB [Nitrosococcus oceani]|uniref:polynucleotide adenylyltransferase PcnB n=1 Tax=Nitrosococcus oceani TaxID=1229 RepID=UPI001FD58C6A|nr:polynucleotide adenylyltransferase PcnB [Nitrosococcus oceani]